MKAVVKHILNKLAFLWLFCTKADFFPGFVFGYEDRTAELSLPGTRFAELKCSRPGYQSIRFQVGKLDAGTEILSIDTGSIEFRCGDQKWSSSICAFLAGLHFSRA